MSCARGIARILAACIALAWTAGAGAATAGVFQFVAGDVRIVSAPGAERAARKGALINVGELVATGADSTAQIKMGDGGIVVVQPRSRLTVAVFNYSGAEDGTERVVFRLEEGGFRSVTGAIGHTHKNTYSIETPVAHMGVRGTDHESYYFPPGSSENPGAYNKVNTGLTFIRNVAGEVLIAPNQVGYVRSAGETPGLLPSIPGFFNRAVAPRTAQLRGLQPGPIRPPVVVQTVVTTDGVNLSNPAASPAPAPVPPVVQDTGNAVGYFTQNGNSGNFNSLTAVNATVAPNGATRVNTGGDSAWGVDWGSWQGGAPTVNGTAAAAAGLVHVIQSTNLTTADQLATLAATGMTATYGSYLGGPAPTNQAGTQGKIDSLSVGVNFGTQAVTYAVGATVDTKTWTAKGGGTVTLFTTSGIPLTGTCGGCTGNARATGTASGAFVGPAAERMITSFGLQNVSGQQAVSGAAYLGR